MGYSTEFKGELKFTTILTPEQLLKVKSFLGEDCRSHPEWGEQNLSYIDLEFLPDLSGLKWDGSEKTYDLVKKVNLIIVEMRKEYPEFGLIGKMLAQGEEIDDRWIIEIINGKAIKSPIETKSSLIKCPHCGENFIIN